MDSERRHWPGATRAAGLADRQGGYSGMYARLIASGIHYFDDPIASGVPERPSRLFAARVAAGAASRALAREGYWPRATSPRAIGPPAEQAPSSASSLKVGSGDELKAPPRRWGSLDQDAEESGDAPGEVGSAPPPERRTRRATPALKRPPRLWKKHGGAAGGESGAGPEDGGGHGPGDQVGNLLSSSLLLSSLEMSGTTIYEP